MERRSFFQSLVSFLGAGVLSLMALIPGASYVVGSSFRKKETAEEWIDLGPVDEFPKDQPSERIISHTIQDGWQERTQSQLTFVLFREGKPEVLSSVCPHLNCSILYSRQDDGFHCPCHRSIFDSQGKLIDGPSQRDMDPLPSKVEEGRLLVRWVEFRTGTKERVEV